MNRDATADTRSNFTSGDSITVLYQGRYNGLAGRYIGLKADPKWADIEVPDGMILAYPVAWLRRPEELPGLAAILAEGSDQT